MKKKLKIKKIADKIFAIILPLYIGWVSLSTLLDYLYKEGIDYFNYTEWDITHTVSVIIVIILCGSVAIKLFYGESISDTRSELKKRLTCEFKKVKIDFNNCRKLSRTILDNENVETYAKLKLETINETKIMVKIVFKGVDEKGESNKITRIYEFDKYDINFLEVED